MLTSVLVGGGVEIMGAKFWGRTVTVKVCWPMLPPESVMLTVTSAEPVVVPATTYTVRFEPLPPKMTLAEGTMASLDEEAVGVGRGVDAASSSASLTVKLFVTEV